MATCSTPRQAASRPAGITCPHYQALPGQKRCQRYVDGGACDRPDQLMCTEWLKANGHQVPQDSPPPPPPPAKDLFGNVVPSSAPREPAGSRSLAPCPRPAAEAILGQPEEQPQPPGLTAGDISSFKALGVSVCLRSEDLGEVWLVPEYTGKDRRELTPEHAATIHRVLEAFPGSKVVAFDKTDEASKERLA